jgi:hypothetical protein
LNLVPLTNGKHTQVFVFSLLRISCQIVHDGGDVLC